MKNNIFYDIDGLRTEKPCNIKRINISNADSVPMWIYVGNGSKAECFEEYCMKQLMKEDRIVENFVFRDMSADNYVCLICLPEDLLRFEDDIYDFIKSEIKDYFSTFYKIIEFDSYDSLRRYLRLCKNINEIRYDNKRKVFYYKISDKDNNIWPDYGSVSFVEPLRYKNCKVANEMFLHD